MWSLTFLLLAWAITVSECLNIRNPGGNCTMYENSEGTLKWKTAEKGEIPAGAIQVGFGVFVARAQHGTECIPGKAAMGHDKAYVSYGGKEHAIDNFEVLCETAQSNSYKWELFERNIPSNAVIGGYAKNNYNDPYHIGRTRINGEMVAGKVYELYAYFPYDSKEVWTKDFEFLVRLSTNN